MCESHLSQPDPVVPRDAGDPATFSRRSILRSGVAMISTAMTVPALLSLSGQALADQHAQAAARGVKSLADVPEDRVLVVIQLSGGNDGLNTVIPHGLENGAYYRARPRLGIAEDELLSLDAVAGGTGAGLALHPELRPLHEMVGLGRAGVHLGVGYPNPNRSHFESMDIWHSADPDQGGGRGLGWLGRAADVRDREHALHPLHTISIGQEAPMATRGRRTRATAFQNAKLFRWAMADADDRLKSAYEAMHHTAMASTTQSGSASPSPRPAADDPAAFLYQTALDAQAASDTVRRAVARRTQTRFPGGELANQLATVAKMIAAELPTRVYYVTLGGFDTHANQAGNHARLLGQFAQAVAAFDAEMRTLGQDSRVVGFAFSEFGRRVAQNASGGTDHGTAGPCFTFGAPVAAGVHGTHPSLTDLDAQDLRFTTDFRSLYAGLLRDWLGVKPEPVLRFRGPAARVLA